jgi:hypothetical protein
MFAEVRTACREIWKQWGGRRPKDLQNSVARRMHVSTGALQENLRKFKIDWREVSRPPN